MKRILDDIVVKWVGGDKEWKLNTPFYYAIGSEDSKRVIKIPKGFRTDFASVPSLFRPFFSKTGPWTPAALVHDYLYETNGLKGKYSRKESDKIFLEAMKIVGINWFTRRTFYRMVRLFGWRRWNETS